MSRYKRTKLKQDSLLKPYEADLKRRAEHIEDLEKRLTQDRMSLDEFANAHEYFGLHKRKDKWIFREWAPNATALYLIGDFTNWAIQESFALNYGDQPGVWEIELPLETIQHEDLYKLQVFWPGGSGERIPAYTRRAVQDPQTHIFRSSLGSAHPIHLEPSPPQNAFATPSSMKPILAWLKKMLRLALTPNSAYRPCPASFKPDTTPSNSWASWNTPTTALSAITSPTSSPPPPDSEPPKSSNNSSTPLIKPVLPSSSTSFTPTPSKTKTKGSLASTAPLSIFSRR